MPRMESGRFTRFSEIGPFCNPGILRGDLGFSPLFPDPPIPGGGGVPGDIPGSTGRAPPAGYSFFRARVLIARNIEKKFIQLRKLKKISTGSGEGKIFFKNILEKPGHSGNYLPAKPARKNPEKFSHRNFILRE